MYIKNRRLFIWFIGLAAIFQSCTETEYLEYEHESANRILEYRVTNTQQELLGAIDNQKNTVTLYIPYYLSVEYLEAEITLDEGAKLLDSLGNEINLDGGLDPVLLGTDPIKYIVESATGTQRNYTLIQEVIPHSETLEVGYTIGNYTSELTKEVHSYTILYGNFNSLSTSAKFWLTNRETGEVHDDFISVSSVSLYSSSSYQMQINILPEAIAGFYDVVMEHQGRKASLPTLNLRYNTPQTATYGSTTAYSPGDTVTFTVRGYNSASRLNGVFVGLQRIYLKIQKDYLASYPEAFTEDLFDKQFELEIIEWNRTEAKAIFPEIPAGIYTTKGFTSGTGYLSSSTGSPTGGTVILAAGLGFYADFNDETIFGKDHGFTVMNGLTVGANN